MYQVVSPEGQTYYFHKRTRITQWETPTSSTAVSEEKTDVEDVPEMHENEYHSVSQTTPAAAFYIPESIPALTPKAEVLLLSCHGC